MYYRSFEIRNYRAIDHVAIDLDRRIIPLVGVNECGKSTILQAIFCFDSTNDGEEDGKHFKDIKNLYKTDSSIAPTVMATIVATPDELKKAVGEMVSKWEIDYIDSLDDPEEDADFLPEYKSAVTQEDKPIILSMQRNLSTKKYSFANYFDKLPPEFQHELAEELISCLPFILYNDDFNDRPPNFVPITETGKNLTGWEAIFDRVFRSANPAYTLAKTLKEPDDKTRKSILSDVEEYLNSALTEEWKRFSPHKAKISTSLSIDTDEKKFVIMIEDQLNGKRRYFNVSNRSKGFIWYYNFIMKVRFNPKHTLNIKDTVFLLDEPGSYLHETAQSSLCKKLKNISSREGVVVYCTHSPRLLALEHVPLNNIYIVEKTAKQYISAKRLSEYKSSLTKNTAMQPVYEALMQPEYELVQRQESLVCVEGIYDKYAIELFADIPEACRLFPSTCAEAIINNIQYFVAYDKAYVALWDNDEEGKRCLGKAKKLFGEHESLHFLLLPSKNAGKRRMEEMFTSEDMDMFRSELKLPPEAKYESIISGLYFSSEAVKNHAKNHLSQESKHNFEILSQMLKKSFDNT